MDRNFQNETLLTRLGASCSDWFSTWFPDAFVIALIAVGFTFLVGLAAGEGAMDLIRKGGQGFWSLSTFTLQMVMVIVGGYVLAATPLARRAVERIAKWPRTARSAIAVIATFSMATSLLSWGFSLIFSGLLVRSLARRMEGLDYRAAGAAAYLGLGAVWAMGLSSSAAMMMATPSAIPDSILRISGSISLKETLLLWQSITTAGILIFVSVLAAVKIAPRYSVARSARSLGIDTSEAHPVNGTGSEKAWADWSIAVAAFVALLLMVYVLDAFRSRGVLAFNLDTYNLSLIAVGLALHGKPKGFVAAVAQSVPATAGVIIQFPFYGMVLGMVTGTGLSTKLSHLFVTVSTPRSYPLLVAAYSAGLGLLIPSGGSKWIVEAPYVLGVAKQFHLHLGWVVQIYNASEALPNLINPFWMLPLLDILRLRAKDLVGYGMIQLAVHAPIVFFLSWLFMRGLHPS